MLRAPGASSAGTSTRKSLLGALSLALVGGGPNGSEDVGGTLGASLRSTRGPTSGRALALNEQGWVAGLFWGEDLAGVALVGLEAPAVSAVLWLAGLLCAVLKLSATELVAAEGSKFTTVEVVSAPAGLFDGEEQEENKGREGGVGSGHRGGGIWGNKVRKNVVNKERYIEGVQVRA